ncbi:hypothetical protein CSAL01_09777 [Colletotrichum salicis]|uniref:Uncharacterized protein n=1 Tax=Colletotrichum salicis TaxID=1209931 RepID=A0A135UFX5_9PEZI|nr:hypothetical protein CSAL01_09777 [Colletotrichum salicis]
MWLGIKVSFSSRAEAHRHTLEIRLLCLVLETTGYDSGQPIRNCSLNTPKMLPTIVRRAAEAAGSKFTVFTNPYRTKKVWPPNFTNLSPQSQLRFEKKYKRRLALVYARPRWNKAVKLAQLVTVIGFLGWTFFFSELEFFGKEYRPSEEIRKRVRGLFGTIEADKRYERRRDAPEAPALIETPK